MEIDSRQNLGDLIMKVAADSPSFFLLGRQNLAGEMPQLLLHVMGLLQ